MLLTPLLYFQLTDAQRAALAEAETAVAEASRAGQPGLLLAQLIDGYAVVSFVEHDRAAQIISGLGGDVTRRVARVEERDGQLVACTNQEDAPLMAQMATPEIPPATVPPHPPHAVS